MTIRPPGPGTATCYTVRVAGHLDERWSDWFGQLSLTLAADGTTTLTGPIADQAELHGLLARIRDLGLVLLTVVADSGPVHS